MDCFPSSKDRVWIQYRQKAVVSRDFTIFENTLPLREMESDLTDSLEPPVGCEREVLRGKELRGSATNSKGTGSGSKLSEEQATMKGVTDQTPPLSEDVITFYPPSASSDEFVSGEKKNSRRSQR